MAGKGDSYRKVDPQLWEEGYYRVFPHKRPKPENETREGIIEEVEKKSTKVEQKSSDR
jgi:hypothetical protein